MEQQQSGPGSDQKRYKEFKLTSFAVDHPTSIFVLTLMVVLMGIASYATVPKESFPEIIIPNIVVQTIAAGVAPKDVEALITQKIEEDLVMRNALIGDTVASAHLMNAIAISRTTMDSARIAGALILPQNKSGSPQAAAKGKL